MSLALIQPAAGLTFGPSTATASASGTMAVGETVKVDLSSLVAASPSVTVTKAAASTGGIYGVVTKEITAAKDGEIQLSGIATGIADGDIDEGNLVTVDANGKFGVATTGEFILGVSCSLDADVTADGDSVKVLLTGCPAIAAV